MIEYTKLILLKKILRSHLKPADRNINKLAGTTDFKAQVIAASETEIAGAGTGPS